MKKLVLFSLLIFFVISLFAQTDYFYLANGEKVSFNIRKDMVVVKCQPQTDIEALVEQSVLISARQFSDIFIIAKMDTLQSNFESLKQHRSIVDVSYALGSSDESLM